MAATLTHCPACNALANPLWPTCAACKQPLRSAAERLESFKDGELVESVDNYGRKRIAIVCGVHEEPGSGTLRGGRWYLLSSREGISWTHSSRVKLLTNEEAR